MSRSGASLAVGVLFCAVTAWAADFDPAGMDFDTLMFHASRYGNTPSKRENKKLAQDELKKRGPEALRYLVGHSHIKNIWFGVYAQELVEQLKAEQAVPVLAGLLDSDQQDVRKNAVYYLGFYDAPAQAARIMPLLRQEKLQAAAVRTLGKWRVKEATVEIAALLKSDDERRRIAAVNALRDIGDPRAAPFLVEALGDRYFTVRCAAQRALASLGPAAEDALVRALPKAEPQALRHMLVVLGAVDSPRARKAVEKYARHADGWVRLEAERALSRQATARGPQ